MFERLKQSRHGRDWWYQGPMIVWAIALFTESSVPGYRIPGIWVFSYDKVIHTLIYVIFAWAVHRGIRYQNKYPFLAKHHYFFTLIIVALYGASDEFHQYFVPMRSCDLYDWFADCLGAIVYILSHWVKSKMRRSVVPT